MKKQFFSLALFAAAWLAGGSVMAHDGDHSYTNGICTIEGCTDKYQAPELVDGWYELTNAGNVEWFAVQVNGGQTLLKAKLTDNIDFTDVSHTPIGHSTDQKYTGEFDGQKFEIRNLKSFTTMNPVGLFGYLRANSTDAAYIHDLVIAESCEISGTNNVGGIAGSMQSATGGNNNSAVIRIENCINNASVTSTNGVASGILGAGTNPYPKLSLKNCLNTGHIKATNNKGSAFCSWQNNSPIYVTSCWNIGVVEGNSDSKNLVVYGYTNNSAGWCTFTNCYDMCTADDHLSRTQGQQESLTTDSPLASGELCYMLNGDQSEISWKQTLLTHDKPQLFEGQQVYKNATYLCPDLTSGDVEYSNSNNSVIPPHNDVDGTCTVCGNFLVNHITPDADGWYHLSNVGDVEWFSKMVNEHYYGGMKVKLDTDIDFENEENKHTPIGTNEHKFFGKFDGQGHKISGMLLTRQNIGSNGAGFFGSLRGGGTDGQGVSYNDTVIVRNLIVDETCSVTSNHGFLAGIVGRVNATNSESNIVMIENCGNEANITSTAGKNCSGILGTVDGTKIGLIIRNCYNTGNISGISGDNGESAAICGWTGTASSGLVKIAENCWNVGEVKYDSKKFNLFRIPTSGISVNNCYDLNEKNSGGIQGTNTTWATGSPLSSGELCYKLGAAFTQDLSQTSHPTFGSKQVILNGTYQNTASTLTLNDANSFGTNSDFNVETVTLTRTLKANTWSTFCVPFNMSKSDLGNGAEVKELTGASLNGENYNMTFSDATSIEAGKPYMVRVPNEVTSLNLGAKTIKGTITPATAGDVTFTGVYNNGNAPQGSFIISNNVFYNVDSTVALKAFRGYITTTSGNNVKALTFDFDDDATGISLMEDGRSQMEDGAIYNVAGQRLDNSQFTIHNSQLKRGIYIVNGKKILK